MTTKRNRRLVGPQAWKQAAKEGQPEEAIRKAMTATSVSEDDEERTLVFNISTPDVDRDGDVISPDGWDLEAYRKNPVVLWAHENWEPPVAKAMEVGIEEKALMARSKFPEPELYPFADMIYRMYKEGYLSAVSVGFYPLEFDWADDRGPLGMDFMSQELLEFSAVPVPSNPEALIQARSVGGIDTAPLVDWAEKIMDGEGKEPVERETMETLRRMADPKQAKSLGAADLSALLKGCEEGACETGDEDGEPQDPPQDPGGKNADPPEGGAGDGGGDPSPSYAYGNNGNTDKGGGAPGAKGTISYGRAHEDGTPLADEDAEWDGDQEVADADVADLLTMCAWYDDENPDVKASYKLPHHQAEGQNPVVWNGVVAAMGALMGARGGVDVPDEDRRGIYDHLAAHYEEFDREPPEFRSVEAQILRHFPDHYELDADTGQLKQITPQERAARELEQLAADIEQRDAKALGEPAQAQLREAAAKVREAAGAKSDDAVLELVDDEGAAGHKAAKGGGNEDLIEVDEDTLTQLIREATREEIRRHQGAID